MSRAQRIRRLILDVALALLFGFIAFDGVQGSSVGLLPAAAGPPLAIAAGAALLFRRYRPLPVLAVTVAAEVLVGATWPMLLAVFSVADRYGNRTRTWVATAITVVAATIPWGLSMSTRDLLINRGPITLLLVLVPALIGLWTNQRAQTLASLRDRADQAERERDLLAAAAVEAERLRIAREMHDIVAHRISQITVLAGALEVSADGKPAEMANTIRETGVQALTEMRELLGVLRQTDAPAGPPPPTPVKSAGALPDRADDRAPLRPAPTLSAITELVDSAVAAGQRVDVSIPARLPAVPGVVGRAAYRVVQEALTNATKHAAGAEARVAVTVRGDSLEVDVRNGPGEPGALAAQGSGFGLVGMRERVELAGGALHSGALPSGGFVVHASFPLPEQP
ncbi:sensor histidine kinase [Nocardia crassostreae]|uniref:sensor histidine kinase n=1 Tax=Nocardia crassostreae TaxID=53428 RepID=UPI0008345AC1|nr:sensor histidine kinase [Nocardia crassostreae]